ncbi:hypothetical protein [Clostridium massiliamazoniense]|uniref:hypothetical protein n=1 Tax=Clostridium massiliamazoniense TaxID=1347366 RepID=UPI0006D85C6D|nr:hypothetical protein [Clostridium massiliamazoniense]
MKNLILFNEKFEIKYLINVCNLELKDNIYNDSYKYIDGQDELFFELSKLLDDYNISFSCNPLSFKERITISDLILTKRVKKKTYTEDQILAKAIMENDVTTQQLKHQTSGLAIGVMENVLNTINLKKEIKALSTALFEMSLKK